MPGILAFLSRVTGEFGHFDAEFRERLKAHPRSVLKTPSDIAGYDAGLATLDKLWDVIKNADAIVHLVGDERGAVPGATMVDEFLGRQPELHKWLNAEQLVFGDWSYTEWEAFLAFFRRHQVGTGALLFVCVPRLDKLNALIGLGQAPSEARARSSHLDVLKRMNAHPNIVFSGAADLLLQLWTSAFGALLHRHEQQDLIASSELAPTLQQSAAARSLRGWPRLTSEGAKGRWLERPETSQILLRVVETDASVTLLLGVPGSGKSALMAHLAEELDCQSILVISIKVDMVSDLVKDAASLAIDLGLPVGTDLTTSLRRLAVDGKVVVLLDQLDALASMVVHTTQRLRVFIDLIQNLSGIDNIHVLASCRSFEQQHDPLLKLINAESVTLELPEWENVESTLTLHGICAKDWNPKLKEVLRNPQALVQFIALLRDGDDLSLLRSYQEMLDYLWERRVLSGGDEKRRAVERVTELLSEREQLWLPFANLDRRAPIDQPIAADILRREGSRIRFRHQTLYEHSRVRGFARDPDGLISAVKSKQAILRARPQIWHGLDYLESRAEAFKITSSMSRNDRQRNFRRTREESLTGC